METKINDEDCEPLDPWANFLKLFYGVVAAILQFFNKTFPLIGVVFLAIILLIYLFFKLLGLT